MHEDKTAHHSFIMKKFYWHRTIWILYFDALGGSSSSKTFTRVFAAWLERLLDKLPQVLDLQALYQSVSTKL